MKKVFITRHSGGFDGLMRSMCQVTDSLKEADIVLFTGGADVSPALYGERKSKMCGKPDVDRDIADLQVYKFAKENGMDTIGICRGAQFLNVMAGGKLVQHAASHTNGHQVKTFDGQSLMVTSTHHQMMIPPKNHMLLAWANNLAGSDKFDQNGKRISGLTKEPEVVFYPNYSSLAVQYHPEYMDIGSPGREFFHQMVEEFIL